MTVPQEPPPTLAAERTHLAWRRTSLSNAMRRFIEASEVVSRVYMPA